MSMLLLLACSAPPEQLAVELPSAYTFDGDTNDDDVDLARLQAEVQAVLDGIRTYNAAPIIDAWYDAHTYSDVYCPAETISDTEANGYVVYFDSECVSEDRYWFKGPMTTYTFEDNTLADLEVYDLRPYLEVTTTEWTGRALKGQTDVFDAESSLDFNCSCTAALASAASDPNALGWVSYTDGPAHWIAPTADPDVWINQGITSNLFMRFSRDGDARWEAEILGSVTGAAEVYGNVAIELRLGGVQLEQGLLCDPDSEFAIEARQSSTGARTRMEFETADGACSACATVGEGEVCVDLTPALDWESSPW